MHAIEIQRIGITDAEYGLIEVPSHTSPALAGVYHDIPGAGFILDTTGVWDISYQVGFYSSTTDPVQFALRDINGPLVDAASLSITPASAGNPERVEMRLRVKTLVPAGFKLSVRGVGGAIVTTTAGPADPAAAQKAGSTVLMWQKVAGFAPVETDTLKLPALLAAPPTSSGKAVIYAQQSAGLVSLAQVSEGIETRMQSMIADQRLNLLMPNGASLTTSTQIGGTWTVAALQGVALTDTPLGRIRKAIISNNSTTGGSVGLTSLQAFSVNTGFHFVGHFSPYNTGTLNTRRFFAGLAESPVTNADLTGQAGLGVHADQNETTLRVRGWDGVATDLGADFPADEPTWLRLELFSQPLGLAVGWKITNLMLGVSASGAFTGPQLPDPGVFMSALCRIISSASPAKSITIGQWSVATNL
jgi:hypothetical protein